MLTQLFFIHALSPLHVGTGRSVGAIDLPIARERPTGIPLVPGSSIKGALRARCEDAGWRQDIFGPDKAEASEHAGSVQFSDAHLLLLPVRSLAGTFAWVTSPYLLHRLARDAAEAGHAKMQRWIEAPAQMQQCLVTGTALHVEIAGTSKVSKVVLEDLDFEPTQVKANDEGGLGKLVDKIGEWLFPDDDDAPWQTSLRERLCVVHDDVMSFLLDTATEVVARVRLEEDTKTVAQGALWYEEALPVESVLHGLAAAADIRPRNKRSPRAASELLGHVGKQLTGGMVQLGGKATVGRGSCLLRLVEGAK